MGLTTHETEASPPKSNSYDASAEALREWQTAMGGKLASIQRHRKRGQSSCLQDAKIAYCKSLVSFANPNQTPEEFAETSAKAQAARDTLCDTEGYGDLDNRARWGLDNAIEAIEFGAMAHICASVDRLGAPIIYSTEMEAYAHSYFDVGSQIPGVN
jgi:hypothetical protein